MAEADTDPIDPLVRYAAGHSPAAIPDAVLSHATDLLQDTVGCILAGSTAGGIDEGRRVGLFFGGTPQATVLGFWDRVSAPEAAFLNAAMAHARDYDDTHDAAVHHGCVTLVPALLAVSEACAWETGQGASSPFSSGPVTGRDFLAALSVGLDVANRLGLAFIRYLHTGWLPTTLWGPIACAAACGRLLGFDADRMGHAFGLGYVQVHGNRQALVDGTLAKRFQPAFSAAAGVRAAYMAAAGVTGPRGILAGEYGIAALYTAGQIDLGPVTQGLGEEYETLNVSIKPYPSCRCTHPVIDAALELRKREGMRWQDVVCGEIRLPPTSMGQIGQPFAVRQNPTVDAQFSAQYTAALALVHGPPRLDHFDARTVERDHAVLDLAQRLRTQRLETGSPGLTPVEIDLELRGGRRCGLRMATIRGSRANPLSRAELGTKFDDCLGHAVTSYSDERRRHIVATIRRLHELEDAAALIAAL